MKGAAQTQLAAGGGEEAAALGEASSSRGLVGLSDELLAEKFCAGDESAFRELYRRHLPPIHGFVARHLRDWSESEETVQEVFVNVFSSIRSYRGEASFRAWLFGLTRRTIAARLRRQRRHPTVPLAEEDQAGAVWASRLPPYAPDPFKAYESKERLVRLEATARTRLTPEQCRLIELRHLEERSIGDIARTLCKSEVAVRSKLYRARRLLLAR